MQRWDDLTPAEQQRYTDNEQRWQQLAAATARAEAAERKLNDVLPQYIAQCAEALQRAEAAESALRLATAAQGQHTGVYMRLDAYQELLSQITAMEEQGKALQVRVGALASERDALAREVAGLRYYIAQLERNVSPEERAYAAQVAQMMLAAQEAQP